eukprot:gnl/Trimastix_PCT/2734.p1 GENE.gnl/Trimastix_PCT/2734~~gnl/Trimastix_PCT/2734.p1  ORF type:complete len:113 (-),score=6.95 gnl/Trimastix_PCT/2734:18-356(-)
MGNCAPSRATQAKNMLVELKLPPLIRARTQVLIDTNDELVLSAFETLHKKEGDLDRRDAAILVCNAAYDKEPYVRTGNPSERRQIIESILDGKRRPGQSDPESDVPIAYCNM